MSSDTWEITGHASSRDGEILKGVNLVSSSEVSRDLSNYYKIDVMVANKNGGKDSIGAFNGNKNALKSNVLFEILGKGQQRKMLANETLVIRITKHGSPDVLASAYTVQFVFGPASPTSQPSRPGLSLAAGDKEADRASSRSIDLLVGALNANSVGDWTVSVPLQDLGSDEAASDDSNLCQGRMLWSSSTEIILSQYCGNKVYVNGSPVEIPDTGLSLTTSVNLVNSSGSDSGTAPAANTLYYVYLGGANAGYRTENLVLSSVSPSLYNGAFYLGATPDSFNYRFIGWVRTNASTQFSDTETARHVVNYYNRQRAHLFTCPKYTNDNAFTSYTTTSGTWVKANGGTGSTVSYIANGEDTVTLGLFSMCENSTSTSAAYAGIGDNSATVAYVSAYSGKSAAVTVACQMANNPSAGYREAHLLIRSRTAGTTSTYYADLQRGSDTQDPRGTALYGIIMA